MGKGARASVVKKNKSKLKNKVFGPVEMARNQRLSAKLLELASQPKPLRQEMDVERNEDDNKDTASDAKAEDNDMEIDGAAKVGKGKASTSAGVSLDKKSKSGRIQKTRHRRARNNIAFTKHPMKKAKKEKARKR